MFQTRFCKMCLWRGLEDSSKGDYALIKILHRIQVEYGDTIAQIDGFVGDWAIRQRQQKLEGLWG